MSPALTLALVILGSGAATPEPLDARLLRSIQLGRLSGVEAAEALGLARDSQASFSDHVLARAALVAAGRDEGFPEWPLPKLLDRALNLLVHETHAMGRSEGLAEGFSGQELVFTLVYALVTTDQTSKAIDVLEQHVSGGGRYETGVVLQALRNIGDARSTRVIKRFVESGDDQNLGENLLADRHYPFLEDLSRRLHLIPPEARTRRELRLLAASGCGEQAALASYFLGFLAPGETLDEEAADLQVLRRATRLSCYHNRFFAVRSLALRSRETIPFWVERFRAEHDAWQRAQLARIGFARFGREFAATALELLADEPSQYVQWELMHGNLELREGARFRGYWDLWMPPALQLHLNFPDGGGAMEDADRDALIAWLETGAHPQNPSVRNHLLYGLARHVSGGATRRFLRVFDGLPDKNREYWVLGTLRDPGALPIVQYWQSLGSPEADQQGRLDDLAERLETQAGGAGNTRESACCEPVEACLRAWLAQPRILALELIATEEQAQAWLREDPRSGEPEISFLDPLKRIAEVRLGEGEPPRRWEHLFGCWQHIDAPEAGVAISR